MNYLEYTLTDLHSEEIIDIVIALLDAQGYSGFEEIETGLKVYLPESKKDEKHLETILKSLSEDISYSCTLIPEINWNARWESGFKPVIVDRDVIIMASFHNIDEEYTYRLLIDPKMSFGTGHHETTRLMIKAMLKEDIGDKKVLDMGCGTGVLAILASMMGAKSVDAIDIDEWAYNNSLENVALNQQDNIVVAKGDASILEENKYQLILANINRNVLLEDMQVYYNALQDEGHIIMSGFMSGDEEIIINTARNTGFKYKCTTKEQKWLSVVLYK